MSAEENETKSPPQEDAGETDSRVSVPPVSAPIEEPVASDAPTPRPPLANSRLLWLLTALPLLGVVELTAHIWQTHSVVPEDDWRAAKALVEKKGVSKNDLIVFAPDWADPLGREYFGNDLASLEREGRADETSFVKAYEVSIRGKHRPELAGWKKVGEEKVGAISVTTLENPAPATVIDDLFTHMREGGMTVAHIDDHESPCPLVHTNASSGGLWFGPATPGDRFSCGATSVGISVLHALDHSARKCFFAPPDKANAILRIRFQDVAFGTVIHGHHGLQHEAERDKKGAPVTLTFRYGDRTLGKAVHLDGTGWFGFEIPTPELQGQKGELTVDVSTTNAHRRHYCFQADTR